MIKLVEAMLVVLSLLVLITQVIIPALSGRKLFPLFRESGELEKEMAAVKQAQYEEALTEEVEAAKQVLVEKQKRRRHKASKTDTSNLQ